MDSDDYRDYLYSKRWFRDRLLILCALIIGFAVVDWLGFFAGVESGISRRLSVAVVVTVVIVAMWLVLGVLGLVGLYRWLRN